MPDTDHSEIYAMYSAVVAHAETDAPHVYAMEKLVIQLIDEINDLKAWKKAQIEVESTWSDQDVGNELGISWGEAIRPQILPRIKLLKDKIVKCQSILNA
jgi:hypothetical protein